MLEAEKGSVGFPSGVSLSVVLCSVVTVCLFTCVFVAVASLFVCVSVAIIVGGAAVVHADAVAAFVGVVSIVGGTFVPASTAPNSE